MVLCLVVDVPFLVIFTFKKLIEVLIMSDVNLIVEWTLFRPDLKEFNSSLECGQIKKMSSM